MNQKTMADIAERKRQAARINYENALQNIREKEMELTGWIEGVKRHGVYLLDERDVDNATQYWSANVYDMIAERCKVWHRPFVKCVRRNYRNIVVVVNGTGVERGLITHMLLFAEQIKPLIRQNRRTGETTERVPNLLEGTGYERPEGPLAQWTTTRTISLLFQDDKGEKMYKEWQEFCRTNQTNRIILGIGGER